MPDLPNIRISLKTGGVQMFLNDQEIPGVKAVEVQGSCLAFPTVTFSVYAKEVDVEVEKAIVREEAVNA